MQYFIPVENSENLDIWEKRAVTIAIRLGLEHIQSLATDTSSGWTRRVAAACGNEASTGILLNRQWVIGR